MYLVSPFYIKLLYKYPNRAWLSAIIIALISIAINIVLIKSIFIEGKDVGVAADEYWWRVYATPWCRLSPYIFGMVVAMEHRLNKERKIFENSYIIVEWIAFIIVIGIGFTGGDPLNGKGGFVLVIWTAIFRPLYGLCLAHLIKLMISPMPEDTIPIYRPIKVLRGFLSMSMWVPIANLSYSVYLWHMGIYSAL